MDISIAYNQFEFLGKEFLTWLWYICEKEEEQTFEDHSGNSFYFRITDKITCENKIEEEKIETVKIKGDGADFKEALVSLKKGGIISELSLNIQYMDNFWDFVLKGENLDISGLKHPDILKSESDEDVNGVILEKIYLWSIIPDLVNIAFRDFYKKRTGGSWEKIVQELRDWSREI